MDVPLGDGRIAVDLPECSTTVCEPPSYSQVDVDEAVTAAMDSPHGRALPDVVDPDDEVAVVVTDVTRVSADEVVLESMLSRLWARGVDRDQVTIVVGLGLHRPMTDEEVVTSLGQYADLAINHDPEAVVAVGEVDGCSIEVHEIVARADTVLSTGVVEPHQYAGFSGGAKTVVIGAGGESQIGYTHGPRLLGRDGVRLGRIEDNPFRDFLDRAGDIVGVDFCCNVSHGPDGILGAAAGRHRDVVADLAERARDALSVAVNREYDAVVAGVGAPKDANLYQVSRAATYLALGHRNPLRQGGRIVIPARLQEGAGTGTGEQRFHEWLSSAASAGELYDAMAEGYEPGAQRAFVLARVLRDHDVWIAESEAAGVVEECLMHSANDVSDAVDPGSDVLVVPDALNTLLV